jgi:D-serine deaminase-like pyridoxal phosphate-dependent protein
MLHERPYEMIPALGTRLADIVTPRPVIDEAVMEANIARVQGHMDRLGLAFRPHIKTHKLLSVARAQIAAGARGINCQKVSEAEVFAAAGFDDILITFNILGAQKLTRLAALGRRIGALRVTADNAETVAGLAASFPAEKPLGVLVECDTGGGRCGVASPDAALALARQVIAAPGLRFDGLLTYPKPGTGAGVEAWFRAALALLDGAGIACPIVSNAGTPSLYEAGLTPVATEYRAGTYVYNDRAMMRAGHCTEADCAMRVLATVVSRPAPGRAIIDAGAKTLTSDLFGFDDFGHVAGFPGAVIRSLSEEHGTLDISACEATFPAVGEQVAIIPNHTCVVTNMVDTMVFHRDGIITRLEDVAARGMVW